MALIDITCRGSVSPASGDWWGIIDIEWSEKPHEREWRRWHIEVPYSARGWHTLGPFS